MLSEYCGSDICGASNHMFVIIVIVEDEQDSKNILTYIS